MVKKLRGFAAMTPEQRKLAAQKGGSRRVAKGYSYNRELASVSGKKARENERATK